MQKRKTIYSETHKKLIDLVTWLPFGYNAEYFYPFMLCMLKRNTRAEIFEMYPEEIKKQILRDIAELGNPEANVKGGAF